MVVMTKIWIKVRFVIVTIFIGYGDGVRPVGWVLFPLCPAPSFSLSSHSQKAEKKNPPKTGSNDI